MCVCVHELTGLLHHLSVAADLNYLHFFAAVFARNFQSKCSVLSRHVLSHPLAPSFTSFKVWKDVEPGQLAAEFQKDCSYTSHKSYTSNHHYTYTLVLHSFTSCTKQNMAMSLSPTRTHHPTHHPTQILETTVAGSARGAHGLWSDPAEVGEKHFPWSSQYLW